MEKPARVRGAAQAGWAAWVLLAWAGCVFSEGVEDDAIITCADASDCPDSHECRPALGRCVRAGIDDELPTLQRGPVALGFARAGANLSVALEPSEPLGMPASLELRFAVGAPSTFRLVDPAAQRFELALAGSEPEGPARAVAHLVDRAGNVADVDAAEVVLDFTAPAFSVGPILPFTTVYPPQRVVVTFGTDEPVATPSVTMVRDDIARALELDGAEGDTGFTFSGATSFDDAEGAWLIVIDVLDRAGNPTSTQVGFTVDHTPPDCGDGVLDPLLEECDDGAENADDALCTTRCRLAGCGDGLRYPLLEFCDDGDEVSGDGCSDACVIEQGYACPVAGEPCSSTCGDGVVASDEGCDDANADPCDGCLNTCVLNVPGCGDGFVCGGESCDDGSQNLDTSCIDCCRSTCTRQTCGDGVVDPGEECDDANALAGDGCVPGTCVAEPGFTCTGSPSACVTTCGDGVRAGSEACDIGPNNDCDGCLSDCTLAGGYTCGDSLVCGAETCDLGAGGAYDDGPCVDCCRSNCVRQQCGDGVLDPSESCEASPEVGCRGCEPGPRLVGRLDQSEQFTIQGVEVGPGGATGFPVSFTCDGFDCGIPHVDLMAIDSTGTASGVAVNVNLLAAAATGLIVEVSAGSEFRLRTLGGSPSNESALFSGVLAQFDANTAGASSFVSDGRLFFFSAALSPRAPDLTVTAASLVALDDEEVTYLIRSDPDGAGAGFSLSAYSATGALLFSDIRPYGDVAGDQGIRALEATADHVLVLYTNAGVDALARCTASGACSDEALPLPGATRLALRPDGTGLVASNAAVLHYPSGVPVALAPGASVVGIAAATGHARIAATTATESLLYVLDEGGTFLDPPPW